VNFSDTNVISRSSEDVVQMTDLKANPGRIVNRAAETGRPVLVTRRGRSSVAEYESASEERVFMRAVIAGLTDIEARHEVSWSKARARLGLE